MATKKEKIEVAFTGKDTISPMFRKLKGGMGSIVAGAGAMAAGFVAVRAATQVLTGTLRLLGGELKKSIESLKQEELATIRLAQAMKTGGSYTEAAYKGFLKYADALERSTLFTADQVIAAEAMLATFKLQPAVLKQALELTLDMATATGQDLLQASILMGKAAVGVTGTLSRYGIIIDQVDLKTRGFAAVVDEMNKEFGGQAQSQLNSYAGAVDQLGKSWDLIVDIFGDVIIKSPAVRGALQTMTENLYSLADAISTNEKALGTLNETITRELLEAVETVAVILPHLQAGWVGLSMVMSALQGDIGGVAQGYKDAFAILKNFGRYAEVHREAIRKITLQLEGNIAHQASLREIQNATKADLPGLILQLNTMTDALADMGFQTANDAAVILALNNRILELTATIKNVPKEALTAIPQAMFEMAEAAADFPQPEDLGASLEGLAAYGQAWLEYTQEIASRTNELASHIYSMMSNTVSRLVDNMKAGRAALKGVFQGIAKDFASIVVDAMLRAWAQAAAMKLMAGPLSFLVPFKTGGEVKGYKMGGQIRHFAGGGFSGLGQDTVHAMLAPGEWIVPRPAVAKHRPFLEDITREAVRGYATGGQVQSSAPVINVSISAIDAESLANALRYGGLKQELQEALLSGYYDIPPEAIG